MGRVRFKHVLIWAVLLLFVVWPLYQLVDLVQSRSRTENTTRLLYRVSLFQIEMLSHSLNKAAAASGTRQLEALEPVLYSADYAHEHLVMALGSNRLATLDSPKEMMQYFTRLQLGGDRPLQERETQLIRKAAEKWEQMLMAYDGLLTERGRVNAAQNEKLENLDKELNGLLKNALLE